MKKNVFIGLFLLSLITYSQSGDFSSEISADLPEINPPSPTAFQMTQYGDISVNESSGIFSKNISLFDYKAGRLHLNIGMNYTGSGVKIDQASGWTGINWNLEAGGVITRTVKDLPDEKTGIKRRSYTYAELNNMQPFEVGNASYNEIYEYVKDVPKVFDSQVDIFNYNFQGYSGSFYLETDTENIGIETNFIVKHIKNDKKIDIEFVFDNSVRAFKITIPGGTVYWFGGLNASENSKNAYSANEVQNVDYATTAFYLYKIENSLNDIIYLDYNTESDINEEIGRSQIWSKLVSQDFECESMFPPEIQKTDILRQTTEIKLLKRIYSNRNSFEVWFNANPTGHFRYKRYLSNITVKDINNQSPIFFKTFNLDYNFYYSRFFLKKIDFNSNGHFENAYHFNYNNAGSLPNRFSFSQDHFGYFNNKPNVTLLPKVPFSVFNYENLANRSFDFDYAAFGLLTEIIYPTGGKSNITYEPKKNESLSQGVPSDLQVLKIYYNDEFSNYESKYYDNISIGPMLIEDESSDAIEPPTQTVRANVDIHTLGTILHGNNVKINVKNILNNTDIYTEIIPLETSNTENIISTTIEFDIVEGSTYNVSLEFYAQNPDPGINPTLKGMSSVNHINAFVRYYYKIGEEPMEVGMRIKSITNTDNGQQISYKRYYYKTFHNAINYGRESQVSNFFLPRYIYETNISKWCQNDFGGIYANIITYKMANLQSSSVSSTYDNENNNGVYNAVTISEGNDFFSNGAIENEYISVNDASTYNYFGTPDELLSYNVRENQSVINGSLLKSTFYENKNNVFFKKMEKSNNYRIDNQTIPPYVNNTCNLFNDYGSTVPNMQQIQDLYVGIFNTYTTIFELLSTQTKKFITDVPYNQEGGIGDYILETSTIQNLFPNMPESVETTNSFGETNRTEITYSNNLYVPKIVEKYKNNELINTVYTVFHSNFPNLLPGSIRTIKGNYDINSSETITEKVIYHSYDNHGNPTEISKANEPHIFYIWGYSESEPIAVIKNITSAQLASIQNLIVIAKQKSDLDNDRTMQYIGNEGILRQALDAIRNHPNMVNALVTTYTYDPFIGLTSVTDPKGDIQYFLYDDFYRLEYVKDKTGMILSENQYHYRPVFE
jgi:hypothetical protein